MREFISCIIIFLSLLLFSGVLFFSYSDRVLSLSHIFRRHSLSPIAHTIPEFYLTRNNRLRWLRLEEKFFNINISLLWTSSNPSGATLTYRCKSFCGGFGDRLRGIITSYILALVTDRHFMIDMTHPSDIRQYLQPNKYNWTFSMFKQNSTRSHVIIHAIDVNNPFVDLIRNKEFIQEWTKYDDIEIYTNLDLLVDIFGNSRVRKNAIIDMFLTSIPSEEMNLHNLFFLFFEILFQPSVKVANAVQDILQRIENGSTLLCTHVRMGQNPSNPLDTAFNDRTSAADDIIQFLRKTKQMKMRKTLLFVTSDSTAAASKIFEQFPNRTLTVPGPILHIDRPANRLNLSEGILKVISDFYMLGECHTSILTPSGFSALANRRRLESYQNLYKYDPQTRRVEHCDDVYELTDRQPAKTVAISINCRIIFNCSVREMK